MENTINEIDDIINKLNINVKNKNLFISAYMCLKAIKMYPSITHIFIYTNITENSDLIKEYIDNILDSKILDLNKEEFYNKSLHSKNCQNRETEITQFKNAKYGIISCVALFAEGFDLPKLNCVCYADNVISEIRIVQSGARAQRIDDDNKQKIACIIIPYIISEGDDKPYKNIINIITQLKTIDGNVEQKITYLTTGRHNKKNGGDGGATIVDKIDYVENAEELGKLKMQILQCKSPDEYNIKKVQEILKIQNIKDKVEAKEYFNKTEDIKLKNWWKYNEFILIDWNYLLSIDTNNFYKNKGDALNSIKTLERELYFEKTKNLSDIEIYKILCDMDNKLPIDPVSSFKLSSFSDFYESNKRAMIK